MTFLFSRKADKKLRLFSKIDRKRKAIAIDRILIGHSMTILFLLWSVMYVHGYERFSYLRLIEISIPPLDCSGAPRTGYGHLNIIVDAEGTYYYHTRVSPLIPNVEEVGCVTDVKTGLKMECLFKTDLKQLSGLMQYLLIQKGEMNFICSFGFTNQASFKEVVNLLDVLYHHRVRKFVWRFPMQEELEALSESRKSF